MNRYQEEEQYDIPNHNPYLGSNILVLRQEARLKVEDVASKLGISKDEYINIEKGKIIPTSEQIKILLPLLRISHYDIMTRNILEERNQAESKMRRSKDRNNYNWYYGDRKKVILDIVYLIIIPVLFLLLLFPLRSLLSFVYINFGDFVLISNKTPILQAYFIVSLISGVIVFIKILMSVRYQFQIWHIFLYSIIIVIVEILGVICTIPYYLYILIRLIILRGRNHL